MTLAPLIAGIDENEVHSQIVCEVANAVVDYFSLVCSKNKSRVAWVSQALTNGSLPLQFTADVMKELVHAEHSPNRLSVVNVGALVLKDMVLLDQDYVANALKLLGNASFWASEGFDCDIATSPARQGPGISGGHVVATIFGFWVHGGSMPQTT